MQLHVTWAPSHKLIGQAGLDESLCGSPNHQGDPRNRVQRYQSPSVSPVQRGRAGPGAEALTSTSPWEQEQQGRAETMGHSEIHKRRWDLPCCLEEGTPELPACCTPTDTLCRENSCHLGSRPDSPRALCVSGPMPSSTAHFTDTANAEEQIINAWWWLTGHSES